MEKPSGRARSPRIAKSRSPQSPSHSPRSKRLRRAKSEKESERIGDRDHDKNHRRGSDRSRQRETDSDRHGPADRRERGSGRDDGAYNNQFSKSRHGRSASPSDYSHKRHQRSRSPAPANRREHDEGTEMRGDDHRNKSNDSLAKMKAAEEALHSKEKAVEKPSFELSGKLAAETNRVRGITLLFNEPPEARKPDIRWRLYVLKNGDVLNEPLYVHRQSCYLFGRERRVADIPTDHPSCSKQHAVLQYRQVEKENSDGTLSKQVKPYIMDLGSTNGTFINEDRIEPQRYYELLEKDNIRFGNSSRMYVLLHENSAG